MAESFAMNGGDGPFSYVRNSDMQVLFFTMYFNLI
uniref:Uncharacterized protein n=1 Tax=Rhizophora mucronata TaxID=61149 RepID=A0A2P2IKQ7_RHIMU